MVRTLGANSGTSGKGGPRLLCPFARWMSLEMVCKVHALVPLVQDDVQPRREDRDQDRAKCSRADWLEGGRMRGEGSALDPLFPFSSTNRHSATKVATKLQPGISS